MYVVSNLQLLLDHGLGDAEVTLAVDTEFHKAQTLTVQVAARTADDTVSVQMYRDAEVPDLPAGFDAAEFFPPEKYGAFCRRVEVRPVKALSASLSPAAMVRDVFGLKGVIGVPRDEGFRLAERLEVEGGLPDGRVPQIKLTLVGHFLTADLFRALGKEFLTDLLGGRDGRLAVRCRRLIQFIDERRPFDESPVVEFAQAGDALYAVRLRSRDTILPFGNASLESHSRSFLGLGKHDAISEDEKKNMHRVFRDRTADAYGYAAVDAVNTLLVFEQMREKDAQLYHEFGFPERSVPQLRPTLGSRVSTFLTRATLLHAEGSGLIKGQSQLEDLMARGAASLFTDEPNSSRFGPQTGQVHGGLLYSRSPAKFWHEADGQLRDVDMAGCYQKVAEKTEVRWGRPVVYEPGDEPFTLADAVALATREADPDAWMVRVTGDIHAHPNALIPSTEDATTAENLRSRRDRRRKARRREARMEARRDRDAVKGTKGSRLYSARVESGVVTRATWLMIEAMPDTLRREYESLAVDSLIFYPRSLAARDGKEYDELAEKHKADGLPWRTTLDMEQLELLTRERIDDDYVTLHFPLGQFARQVGRLRREAQDRDGKKSGMDLAWKLHANSMYGVLCCKHLPTSNFVAANVITAHARAEAFAVGQALNCLQTITDGCTYRRDQIPATTFAECLKVRPDYTVRRAEAGDGIPFLDPDDVPGDDEGFTAWLHGHLKWFYGVEGEGYDSFFGTHAFEHKKTGDGGLVAFDALGCDGSGGYLKCLRDPRGNWQVADFAARSFGKDSKKLLAGWLAKAYSTDTLEGLAPLAQDTELLSFERARQKARKLLARGMGEAVFPLRFEWRKPANYRILKPSAFVFKSPAQRTSWLKAIHKFEKRTGAGLEVLGLRRNYRDRRRGSLAAVAEEVYKLVLAGEMNPGRALNLARRAKAVDAVCGPRLAEMEAMQRRAEADFALAVDARRAAGPTGYLVDADALRVEVRRRLACGRLRMAEMAGVGKG